jgi:hypothetical protein
MVNPKKIIALSMLLLVFAPVLVFTGFVVSQIIIQHQMEERLETSLLQTITVDQEDFQWVKKNKEINIGGRLFDVKSFKIYGNKLVVTGLYDDDENQLKESITRVIHRKSGESFPVSQLIVKFIFNSEWYKTPLMTISSFSKEIQTIYSRYSEAIVTKFPSINTPPPNS